MITVFLKSTVRPCPSVSRPSSSTCKQHVEHIVVRLLDFVEQHHLIGPPAHGFGQHAAFLIADIARRRADQPRDRVLLHELRHVDADHRGVVVEQECGERLGQLGLADAGGAQEQERADRPVRILQPGARAAHGIGDGAHRLVLADHAAGPDAASMCSSFSRSPSSILSTGMPVQRDTTCAMCSSVTASLTRRELPGFFGGLQLALEIGDDAVGELARAREIAAALRDLELLAGAVDLFLQLLRRLERFLLLVPARGQRRGLLFQLGELGFQLLQPILRGLVGFLLQRLALDLELDDAPVELVQFLGLGVRPASAGGSPPRPSGRWPCRAGSGR